MAEQPSTSSAPPQSNGSATIAPQQADTVSKQEKKASVDSKKPKKPSEATESNPSGLTPAQLKKQKQAEKAARRAKEKSDREGGGGAGPANGAGPAASTKKGDTQKQGQKDQRSGTQQGKGSQKQDFGGSSSQKNLPIRTQTSKETLKDTKKEKEVGLFGHLYGQPRRHTVEGAAKEVHPAIQALGLQMSSYVVCGSTARCVAMLLAFKQVIESYSTPPGTSLARHLTSHHLVCSTFHCVEYGKKQYETDIRYSRLKSSI